MKREKVGALTVENLKDGLRVRWAGEPRALQVIPVERQREMVRSMARFTIVSGLGALIAGVGALGAGIRLLDSDRWWGISGMVAGSAFVLAGGVVFLTLVGVRAGVKQQAVYLRSDLATQFEAICAMELHDLGSDPSDEERDATARRLWDLAVDIHRAGMERR